MQSSYTTVAADLTTEAVGGVTTETGSEVMEEGARAKAHGGGGVLHKLEGARNDSPLQPQEGMQSCPELDSSPERERERERRSFRVLASRTMRKQS